MPFVYPHCSNAIDLSMVNDHGDGLILVRVIVWKCPKVPGINRCLQIAKDKEKKEKFHPILQWLLKSLICWYVIGNGMYGFQTGD